MLNLIKKDFLAGWVFLPGIIVIIPFLTAMQIWAMMDDFGGIVVGFFTFITMFLCIFSSFAFVIMDTTSNMEMMYPSLPISRHVIVLARYASSFMLLAISLSLVVLTMIFAVYLFNKNDPAFEILLSMRGIITMAVFLLFILSFILPFIFKFGSGRGVIAALITQLVIVFIMPLGEFILEALKGIITFDLAWIQRFLKSLLEWIISLPAFSAYLLLFTVIFTVILLSITLSVRFYNKLDL